MFKFEISSDLATSPILASLSIRRYCPPLNAAFSKWPPSQINCPPLAYNIKTHMESDISVGKLSVQNWVH